MNNIINWTEEKKERTIEMLTEYFEKHGTGESISQSDEATINAHILLMNIADDVLGSEGILNDDYFISLAEEEVGENSGLTSDQLLKIGCKRYTDDVVIRIQEEIDNDILDKLRGKELDFNPMAYRPPVRYATDIFHSPIDLTLLQNKMSKSLDDEILKEIRGSISKATVPNGTENAKQFILHHSPKFQDAVDNGYDIRMDENEILLWMEMYKRMG